MSDSIDDRIHLIERRIARLSKVLSELKAEVRAKSKLSKEQAYLQLTHIIEAVATEHHYSTRELLEGKSRRADDVWARYKAMYLCMQVRGVTWQSVGRIFGKHHATVMYGVGKVEDAMNIPEIRGEMAMLAKKAMAAARKGR